MDLLAFFCRHRAKRQAVRSRSKRCHQSDSFLDGNWIADKEHRISLRNHDLIEFTCPDYIPFFKALHQILKKFTAYIAADRNEAAGADRKKGQGQTVISTIDGEIFRHDAIKLRYLGYVSGSFLDTHDIGTIFDKPGHGKRFDIGSCAARNIVDQDR